MARAWNASSPKICQMFSSVNVPQASLLSRATSAASVNPIYHIRWRLAKHRVPRSFYATRIASNDSYCNRTFTVRPRIPPPPSDTPQRFVGSDEFEFSMLIFVFTGKFSFRSMEKRKRRTKGKQRQTKLIFRSTSTFLKR